MAQSLNAKYMMSQNTGNFGESVRGNTWEIAISGIDITLMATSVQLPRWEVEQGELAHFNTVVKYGMKPKCSDMRIVYYDAIQPDVTGEMQAWYDEVHDTDTDAVGFASDYKTQARVAMMDSKGNLVRTWVIDGVFPKSSPQPDEALDYNNHEVTKISMEFSCDGITKG